MSTTAAILELLVIGIQSLIWLAMLIVAIFGPNWLPKDFLLLYKDYLGIIGLSFAYPLGVMIDEFADEVVFGRIYRKLRDAKLGGPKMFELMMETQVAPVRMYFDYSRTKIRLVRSTCVNFWMGAVVGAVLVVRLQLGWNGWICVIRSISSTRR